MILGLILYKIKMKELVILLTLSGLALTMCPANCANCTDPQCSSCKTGYYLSSNICTACASTCQTCTNGATCATCFSGYFRNSSNLCQSCSPGCSSCSNSAVCSSCNSGSYLNNSRCQPCPSNCASCSSSSNCSSCSLGYYFIGFSCVGCPNNCLSCSDASTCQSCISNYVYYPQLASCSSSKCDPSTCKTCENNYSACSLCNNNYFLSNGSCVSCPSSCLNCSNNLCQSCANGTYLSNNYCYACISFCSSCSKSNSCDICSNGYSVVLQNSTQICQINSSSSGLLILMPIFSSVISSILIALCIYRSKLCTMEQPADESAESMERIIPMELQWKQCENKVKQQEELCPICLDSSPELETKCGHLYHLKCLLAWCGNKKTCPFCREAISQLRVICVSCKKNGICIQIGQAKQLKTNNCRECQAVLSKE